MNPMKQNFVGRGCEQVVGVIALIGLYVFLYYKYISLINALRWGKTFKPGLYIYTHTHIALGLSYFWKLFK